MGRLGATTHLRNTTAIATHSSRTRRYAPPSAAHSVRVTAPGTLPRRSSSQDSGYSPNMGPTSTASAKALNTATATRFVRRQLTTYVLILLHHVAGTRTRSRVKQRRGTPTPPSSSQHPHSPTTGLHGVRVDVTDPENDGQRHYRKEDDVLCQNKNRNKQVPFHDGNGGVGRVSGPRA